MATEAHSLNWAFRSWTLPPIDCNANIKSIPGKKRKTDDVKKKMHAQFCLQNKAREDLAWK